MQQLVTYDTSIFVSYKPELPSGLLMSAVVIQELSASSNDDSELKYWLAVRRAFEKEDRLIVPSAEDWELAGKILYWLAKGRKKKAGGKSPPLIPGATQRMALDALIAVSARRAKATVVTANWKDFDAIQKYCKDFKFIKGEDYFS